MNGAVTVLPGGFKARDYPVGYIHKRVRLDEPMNIMADYDKGLDPDSVASHTIQVWKVNEMWDPMRGSFRKYWALIEEVRGE